MGVAPRRILSRSALLSTILAPFYGSSEEAQGSAPKSEESDTIRDTVARVVARETESFPFASVVGVAAAVAFLSALCLIALPGLLVLAWLR